MFEYSVFDSKENSDFPWTPPFSNDYKVYINGKEIPVYSCRISKYPFNTWWPGHQRQIEQSEVVSHINLVSDEEICIEVEPLAKQGFEKIMLKPYSKGIKPELVGDRIVFTLKENGGYVLELDDYHGLLYIFNNKPIASPDPEDVTYYFGKGIHFPGKITLKSNQAYTLIRTPWFTAVFLQKMQKIYAFLATVFLTMAQKSVFRNTAINQLLTET